MSHSIPACVYCKRFDKASAFPVRCEAFPTGIPDLILRGGIAHLAAFPGDHGKRFSGELPDEWWLPSLEGRPESETLGLSADEELGKDQARDKKGRWTSKGGGGGGGAEAKPAGGKAEEVKPAGPLSFRGLTKDSPEVKEAAAAAHARAVAAEPEMSRAVLAAAASGGGEVAGFDFRLKSGGGIAEKGIRDALEAEAKGKSLTPQEAIARLSDLNRYTIVSPPEKLVSNTRRAHNSLVANGWTPTKQKNFYGSRGAYRGYNTVYSNAKGDRFELQFHTPESIVIKEEAHHVYEKYRVLPRRLPGEKVP